MGHSKSPSLLQGEMSPNFIRLGEAACGVIARLARSGGPLVVGIDIGHQGACAFLTADGELIDVADMPVLPDGPAGRPTINAPLIAEMFRYRAPREAYIEFVGAWPGDGSAGAFAFGRCRGCIEGVLATLAIRPVWLTVPSWRRLVGFPSNATKDQARAAAIARWPADADFFRRKRDDGRAEAALIALAGLAWAGGVR